MGSSNCLVMLMLNWEDCLLRIPGRAYLCQIENSFYDKARFKISVQDILQSLLLVFDGDVIYTFYSFTVDA